MKQNLKTKEKGITLIALVITIIILLILAAVTIAALSGDNGILSNAAKAKRETEIAEIIEQIRLELYGEMADNGGADPTEADIETIADEYGDITGDTFADKVLKTDKGNYEIKLSDIWTPGSSTEDPEIPDLPEDAIQAGEMATAGKNAYYSDDKRAVIPEGFTVSNVDGEKTINGGLVIYYIPKGTNTSGDFWTVDSDGDGSPDVQENYDQYVWIPVDGILGEDGTTIADVDGTNGEKKVLLGRYDFDTNGRPLKYTLDTYKEEDSKDTENLLNKGNKIAEDIGEFIQSVRNNDGYYIARYEAGVVNYDNLEENNSEKKADWTGYSGDNMKLVIRRDVQPWNYITQNRAGNLCVELKNSYTKSNVTSDLINSYAWDTAILFIQNSPVGDEDYSRHGRLQSTPANTGKATDGSKNDNPCNIYDMAGNFSEWSTETTTTASYNPCVRRGASYASSSYFGYTSVREPGSIAGSSSGISFRPLLYVK